MPTYTLDTVSGREKLKPRREPYWHRVTKGCYLGYRVTAQVADGGWIARRYEAYEQSHKSLGSFGHLSPGERFDAAKKEAEAWFTHCAAGGAAQAQTVSEACAEYVVHVTERRGEKAARDVSRRFEQYVLDNKRLANTELAKLTPAILKGWRKGLATKTAEAGPNKGGKRAGQTLNRDLVALRAALNLAYKEGAVTSDFAWRSALSPVPVADGRRQGYLSPEQRAALVQACGPGLRELVRLLCMVPLRPGAAAALRVSDFDASRGLLTITTDKAGAGRALPLPPQAVTFLQEQARNKLPSAWLLTRADGKPWDKDAWKKPVRAAAQAAGLPEGTVLYSLRHSTITDMCAGGTDLLTVALLSGTSVLMIQKFYGKVLEKQARAALGLLQAV